MGRGGVGWGGHGRKKHSVSFAKLVVSLCDYIIISIPSTQLGEGRTRLHEATTYAVHKTVPFVYIGAM